MNILWFSWKDKLHPASGGAEIVNETLAKKLVEDGHNVTFIVGGFDGGIENETIDGYKIIRLGNRYTLYIKAFLYYRKNLRGWADIVIEEINTFPFFTRYYVKEKRLLFIHQLCREIWFYQMIFPLSIVGYLIEPIYLHLLNKDKVITISKSTRNDLMKYGFKKKNISIISEGIELEPIESLNKLRKFKDPTILSLGTIRSMKRTIDQLDAFELAKKKLPKLKLIVVGNGEGRYFKIFLKKLLQSQYKDDIKYLGRVGIDEKKTIMGKSTLITVTSIKEGWGLIVSEAGSQATPAIVYDVDGLRDSVVNNVSGYITTRENSSKEISKKIIKALKNKKEYNRLRENAWKFSKELTFDKSYNEFIDILKHIN